MLSPRDWATIVSRLHEGQCVPFLGAGVNVAGPGYEGLPLAARVTLSLANDLMTTNVKTLDELAKVEVLNDALKEYPHLLRLQLQNLASVAFHLSRAVDSPRVMSLVGDLLEKGSEPSKLLQTLARMPNVRLIVTTNYDLLMETALNAAGREFVKFVQPVPGFKPDELLEKDDELCDAKAAKTLILYKIHGSFPDPEQPNDKPDEIVLTEEDYIQFLTVVANDAIGIPPAIKSEMTSSTLLFLGYSLEDWDFRTLFKGTIEKLERYKWFKSFAIQWRPDPFWAKFWEEEKKVVIYDLDLHEFASDLAQRYDAYVESQEKRDGE
jgi:hypothetical protein